MAYKRKTIDIWELQINYGCGWEYTFTACIHKEGGHGEAERIQRERATVPGTTD